MNEWREVAIKMLPEVQSDIEEAESPMALWVEIIFYFDEAYEEPRNDDFISRGYDYVDWCLNHDVGDAPYPAYVELGATGVRRQGDQGAAFAPSVFSFLCASA